MADVPKVRPGSGLVIMTHPSVDGYSQPTTEKAFKEVWEPKGWKQATATTAKAPTKKEGS